VLRDDTVFQDFMDHFLESKMLSDKERQGLYFVKNMTTKISSLTSQERESLREAEYTDEEILHLVEIAAYFNFINRMATALDVSLEKKDFFTYKR
jgi:alkylhydroperoxidase family enzyme